jgi:hypothetical protein
MQAGLWNLLQLRHGGELAIPTYFKAELKVYFGAISPNEFAVEKHLIRWRMRAPDGHKIGISAVATTGRIGYLYPAGDRFVLVIRNFQVRPSGEYIDVPWNDPEDYGCSAQACSVHTSLGQFSEIEYHVPAIGQGTGSRRCEDVSEIWAFRGEAKAVRTVACSLLGGRP